MCAQGCTSPIPCFETDRVIVSTDTASEQTKYRVLRVICWRFYISKTIQFSDASECSGLRWQIALYRLVERAVPEPVGRHPSAQLQHRLGEQRQLELGFALGQGLLEIDFNQPPSIRPISAQVESSCW